MQAQERMPSRHDVTSLIPIRFLLNTSHRRQDRAFLVDMEEANKLIGAGKKHLVMGKVVDAVSTFQEACGILAKEYGDTADECAEAFFWCGNALLSLARMENSVLGNALEGVPDDDEEDEKPKNSNVESTESVDDKTRDELRVQVYDAMAEKSEDSKKKDDGDKKGEVNGSQMEENEEDKAEHVKGDEVKSGADKVDQPSDDVRESTSSKMEDAADKTFKAGEASDKKEGGEVQEMAVDEVKEEAEKMEEDEDEDKPAEGAEVESEESAGEENDNGEKQESDEEEEGNEEVGNLQLAWEMLEVAKVIYKRKESKEDQLMAAQTHLRLGEVSVESGNYTQALEDFQECLSLQLQHLESDSRLVAETHYQLGVTFGLNLQFGEAIQAFNCSASVIKSRLEKLQGSMEKKVDMLSKERKEADELESLLPDIQEKVVDATDGLKTIATETLKAALDDAFPSTVSAGSNTDTSAINRDQVTSTNGSAAVSPVSNISHLVRKKRKPEESPVKEGLVKKVKQDDTREAIADSSKAH
ncbi:nuclear autoantigenic sperm protein-like [Stigmatopora nigra]